MTLVLLPPSTDDELDEKKSADRRERACDGSLAACPLRALKDAGRTSASVM